MVVIVVLTAVEEEAAVIIPEIMQREQILSGGIRIMKEVRLSLKVAINRKDPQESIIRLEKTLKVKKTHLISQEKSIITTLAETKWLMVALKL